MTNYQKLISSDHVNLTFGPFSSLLTLPAARAVERYGYAMVEGAGGAPSVFSARLKNVFDVALPVANSLVPFANWISSLPKAQRPTTVAYVTSDDPFTEPQIPVAQKIMKAAGIKTVYNKVFPAEATDYTPIADAVAAAKAQVVVLGSVDVPDRVGLHAGLRAGALHPQGVHRDRRPRPGCRVRQGRRRRQRRRRDGAQLVVRTGREPAEPEAMVAEYIKKYGGTAAGVNADVAEAYAVGQVVADAVKATGGFNNAKIITYLHSGVVTHDGARQGEVRLASVRTRT